MENRPSINVEPGKFHSMEVLISSAEIKITINSTYIEKRSACEAVLLNLLFYHFNHSEPSYKSQCIKLLDVIATCNQLNENALN